LIVTQFQATGIPFHARHEDADELAFNLQVGGESLYFDWDLAESRVDVDAGQKSLAESDGLAYRVGWMRDNEWGQEGNFQWQDVPLRAELAFGSAMDVACEIGADLFIDMVWQDGKTAPGTKPFKKRSPRPH
jgi:hypothetical protein